MGILKSKMETHLRDEAQLHEVQTGFATGRRMTDNIFMLKYIIGKSFSQKLPQIVISRDFSKAFDSINRGKLIEAMKNTKIHPDIINFIGNI